MAIEYRRSKRLRVIFYSLIINASKIKEVFGSMRAFGKRYDLTGVTNGEILIMYFMSYPDDDLIADILESNGFEYKRDFVLAEEELTSGVRNIPSPGLNHPLSCLKDIIWLGSILKKDGNWIWKKNAIYS